MPLIQRRRNLLPPTGQTTTAPTANYQAGDDGDYQAGYVGTRFVDNGDGTISDHATGLMWVQDPINDVGAPFNAAVNWSDAITNTEALTFAGYTDWRLPNILELCSLYNADDGTTPSHYPSFVAGPESREWSSTTRKISPTNAFYFSFGSAFGTSYAAKATTYTARPVRGGRFNG